ncbi:MAG: hypothetical protein LQ347_001274 [Umbilicaria vellea]|nr:MAG: hypothetical protein LQ347_001274 [Umbilicaria vellea]
MTYFSTTCLCLNFLFQITEAKLPFGSTVNAPVLRKSSDITFDPLGVAAVLGNPRADLSAARLYVQSDRKIFRWPHTTMVGGALTPVKTLVDHLAQHDSIHPAVSMCTRDEMMIPIRSNTVFQELRVNVGNLWLRDVINFKPSKEEVDEKGDKISGWPNNDIAIAYVGRVFDPPASPSGPHSASAVVMLRKLLITMTGAVTGLLLSIGACFSILTGDIWGAVLFIFYLSHWTASTVISHTQLVATTCPEIRTDDTIRFAVYERPVGIGGTVVFKGAQHDLETWARTTLQFRNSSFASILHWSWLVTGTLSAISSIACMVNMSGKFQLVFLGVLVYSSLAELWLTQSARVIQRKLRESAQMSKVVILRGNQTRTKAIIRGTLSPDVREKCSLAGLDWTGLNLLPKTPIFTGMQDMLRSISASTQSNEVAMAIDTYKKGCYNYGTLTNEQQQKDNQLIDRIIQEAEETLEKSNLIPLTRTEKDLKYDQEILSLA